MAGTSAWTGKIATLPGGAVLTISNTTGTETALVPSSTAQLAKLRVYNTTRGNPALVFNHVTGTHTLTLTESVQANWQVNDGLTIASQTVTGGGKDRIDLELVDGPLGKSTFFLYCQYTADTVGRALRLHPFETCSTAASLPAVLCEVANVNNHGLGLYKCIGNMITISWDGNTTRVMVREAGYR